MDFSDSDKLIVTKLDDDNGGEDENDADINITSSNANNINNNQLTDKNNLDENSFIKDNEKEVENQEEEEEDQSTDANKQNLLINLDKLLEKHKLYKNQRYDKPKARKSKTKSSKSINLNRELQCNTTTSSDYLLNELVKDMAEFRWQQNQQQQSLNEMNTHVLPVSILRNNPTTDNQQQSEQNYSAPIKTAGKHVEIQTSIRHRNNNNNKRDYDENVTSNRSKSCGAGVTSDRKSRSANDTSSALPNQTTATASSSAIRGFRSVSRSYTSRDDHDRRKKLKSKSHNPSRSSSNVRIINILGKDIIKLPSFLEREIKIKKYFYPLGISGIDCQIDEGMNGCVITKIEDNSACSRDNRLRVGDFLVSVNNEQMRSLSHMSAKSILNRASLTSKDVM